MAGTLARRARREPLSVLVTTALALLLVLAPAYRQLLHGNAAWVPRWVMFSGKGLGIHRVHIELESPAEERRVLLWNDFQPERPGPVRASVARSERDIFRTVRVICRQHPEARVYVTADRAVRGGWRPVLDGTTNLCERRPPRRQR